MSPFPLFLMRVLKTSVAPEAGRRMCIVVQRPVLTKRRICIRASSENPVQVTVDRRRGERRRRVESVSFDRRQADRRQIAEGDRRRRSELTS
jgi:hypothetical protein